ncbi:MAG: DUF624 domain-containing protein [Oscillospiraceae bacterium]|jgi:uncharacterized membrane protein YesL|nr:DUF624 domain-containing protein [Oscillospiraceae bacterium]
MKLQFQNDSPIGQFVGRVLELIGLNILWAVCCLPVVTAGAATCALHFVLSPQRNGDEGVFRCFFRSFRRNFRQATLLWLLLLALGLLLALCLRIVSFWNGTARTAGIIFFCVPALFLLIIAGYGFPLLAQFEIPARKLVEDALLLGLAHFPRTLGVVGLTLLPAALWYFLPSLILCVLFIWLPVGFSLTALWMEKLLEPVFAPYREDF